MCGIAGVLGAPLAAESLRRAAVGMAQAIRHRGPDDHGCWVDGRHGLAMAHRRLAVLDLSPAGRQPMTSACGRFVIVFNGEIYNHPDLRRELSTDLPGRGFRGWRGHSDTETLIEAIAAWGVQVALDRSVGMFAFALWDAERAILTLARDRIGEKPLYYGWQGPVMLFASDLAAIRGWPGFAAQIDRDAIAQMMRFSYIPAPRTIYQGFHKVPPGTYVQFALDAATCKPVSYWSLPAVVSAGARNPFRGSTGDAVSELDRLLRQSVAGQLSSDVPVGAFLSGGIDSSAVVGVMQSVGAGRVKTFTIGFDSPGFDEARHARAVAECLGTEHTQLYVSAAQAMKTIPLLPEIYSEPFADSSQIPTFLVSRLARELVTVSLSGDGGDELLGGYVRYVWARRVRSLTTLPVLKPLLQAALAGRGRSVIAALLSGLAGLLPAGFQVRNPADKLVKLGELLDAADFREYYDIFASHWRRPEEIVIGATSPVLDDAGTAVESALTIEERMMLYDTGQYLPGDILVKVDRAAMAVSLETRVPLLDHRIVEFAWSLPFDMKFRHGTGKWLLRQVLHRYVPRELVERPKMGFGIPLGDWLRGPLKDWAEGLLDEQRLRREGFFHPAAIRKRWQEHLAGVHDWHYYLWDVLMFQAWHEYWIAG